MCVCVCVFLVFWGTGRGVVSQSWRGPATFLAPPRDGARGAEGTPPPPRISSPVGIGRLWEPGRVSSPRGVSGPSRYFTLPGRRYCGGKGELRPWVELEAAFGLVLRGVRHQSG